jgi:HK97 family phage portal protein
MPYSEKHASHAINFIKQLKLTKGKWAGKPFILLPWELDLIKKVFGTLREDGTRQYRTVYVEIGKKNGKSEIGAAIALYMLLADGEENAEVYVAACDRQQASIIFNTSVNFVDGNNTLSRVTKTIRSTKRIVYPRTGSFYQVLSSDVKSKSGLNVSCVILDEIWTYPNADLAKMLTTGSGDAREQPLFIYLTTAGNKLSGYGWDMHCRAKDILEGKRIDNTFLPIIYGLNEDDDWEDEKNWYKANPSLGHTIQLDRVREAYEQAKLDPVDEALFKQLRLNTWLKQQVKWMPMDTWDKCAFEVNAESLKGRECYGGLDLSSSTDITAFVLIFPPTESDDKYYVLPYFWIPEDNLNLRVRRDHVPYDIWKKQGYLKTTEGNVIHYAFIEKFIEELGKKYNIKEIGFDRWGAVQMVQNLEGLGFTVVPFGQGFKDMSPPSKRFMELALEKKMAHGGHPVLSWMVDNIYVRTDPAGNIKPDKEKSTEKIDDVPSEDNLSVDPQANMSFSAVFACNRVLSETLASCPIFLYEKDSEGNRTQVTDAPEYGVLHYAPNAEMTPGQFKEFGMSNINLGGNLIAQKVFNMNGELLELRPITWDRVRIDVDNQSGRLLYYIDGNTVAKTRDEILHIPGLTLDGYIGITPLTYAALTIDIGLSQDKFERNFYYNRASTSGIFQYPNELGDEAFQRLKKDIKKNYSGFQNAGVPMILEGGGQFKEVTMKLTDAQFIESKRFRIEDVCRVFRVPLHLVQDLSKSTNNNIEQQSLEFIMYTMLPWFKRWEENLNLQLLSPDSKRRNRYFEFNISGILRGDIKSRYDAYAQGRQWGWLSVNDIRRLENMNPVEGGDIYMQPLNCIDATLANEYFKKQDETNNKMLSEIYNILKRE